MLDPHKRPNLGDDHLRLRAPVQKDVQARLALGNTPDIIHMFGVPRDTVQPITIAQAADWVEAQLREPLAFVIEREGQMIGSVRLHSLNLQDKRASLAIALLDPDLLGRGIGRQAMSLILSHAFNVLGLNRITLRVIEYNARAIAAYEKLGFVHEGRERQSACVGDEYHDDLIMGLLASEWSG